MKKIIFSIIAFLTLLFTINFAIAEQIIINSCINDSHGYGAVFSSNCTMVYDGELTYSGYAIYTYSGAERIDVTINFNQSYIDHINVSTGATNVVTCLNNITVRSGDSGLIIGFLEQNTCSGGCSTSGGGARIYTIPIGSSENSLIVEGKPACNGVGSNPPISWDFGAFYEIQVYGTIEDFENESVDYDQYQLILSDSIETNVNIVGMDYDNDDEYTGIGAFIGFDETSSVIGIVDLYLPNQFSIKRTQSTDTNGYKAVDVYQSTVWVSGNGIIQRFGGILSSLSIVNKDPVNYTASGIFKDIYAINDSYAVACYEITGSDFVQSFKLNTSNEIELLDSLSVDNCNGIIFNDNILYVDKGVDGIELINYTDSTSLVSIDDLDLRTNPVDFGRHDLLSIKNNYLLSDTNSEISILIDITDKTNISDSELTCEIDEGSIMSVELINDSQSYISSSNNGDLYLCDYIKGSATLVYDSSFNELAFDMNLLQEANQNYVYTYEGSNLLVFTLTNLDVDNDMPSFFASTPDSAYIDNLNPIVVGGDPLGIESPVVAPYPLNCINQFYECSFDAEGDNILFAVDKDYSGVLSSPSWNAFEGITFSYTETGNYTMRIYLTDDVHENLYSVYRDFDIEVKPNATALGENESTLKFLIKDFNTNTPISLVYVDVDGGTDGYTSAIGVYNEIIDSGVYLVTFSKVNYVDKSEYFSTSPLQNEVLLVPINDPNLRTLIINVQDINADPLNNIFIQIQMPYIVEFDFAYTDASGKTVFYPNEDNVVIIIDAEGYNLLSVSISVPLGSTVTKTITLSNDFTAVFDDLIDGGGYNLTGCQDHIRGVLLCDYDKITNCTSDGECITGQCAYNGHCSNFNWNLCDEQNLDRGNRCVFKNISKGVMASISKWIIDNFFYVLIIVLLLIGFLILALKNKK